MVASTQTVTLHFLYREALPAQREISWLSVAPICPLRLPGPTKFTLTPPLAKMGRDIPMGARAFKPTPCWRSVARGGGPGHIWTYPRVMLSQRLEFRLPMRCRQGPTEQCKISRRTELRKSYIFEIGSMVIVLATCGPWHAEFARRCRHLQRKIEASCIDAASL